jgi:hypothetical protein
VPYLLISAGQGKGVIHRLGNGNCVIGRDSVCDLVLADETVSRKHAAVEPSGDARLLRDLGSRNGIFVDGLQTREARLVDGSTIVIGSCELRYFPGDPPDLGKRHERTREKLPRLLKSTDGVVGPAELFIGASPSIIQVLTLVKEIAATDTTIGSFPNFLRAAGNERMGAGPPASRRSFAHPPTRMET